MDEVNIWKAADEMVLAYGEDADLHAAMRAEAALDKGDSAGEFLWNRVTGAIIALRLRKTGASEALN